MNERTNGLTNEVLREGRKLGKMEGGRKGREVRRQADKHG